MMTFTFNEKTQHSRQEKQDAQDYFLKYIGDMRKEFEDADVTVEVNMDAGEFQNRYTFNSNKADIGSLVDKLQQYRRANPSLS